MAAEIVVYILKWKSSDKLSSRIYMLQKKSQFNCMTLSKGSAKDSILYYYYSNYK